MQGTKVLREEITNTPAWSYSSDAQAQDGLAGPFTVQVAQVSALYGAGVFARLDVAG